MHTSCPHCGGITKKYFSAHDFNQRISELEFDYYRCNECGLIFLDPIPNNIHDYYGQEYPAYRKVEDIKKEATDYDLGKIAILKKYAQGKRLLEIGPGGGTFAYLAKQEGFIVDAIEMDANCCKFLEESIKIQKVVNSNDVAGALGQLEGGYDVIVMWHVLEHLKDPWDVLRSLPNVLAPNGVVMIAVPNPDALQFKLFKKYWKHVDAPRHVVFLPMKFLIKELDELGLKKILVSTNDKVSSIFNVCGWWLNSLNGFIVENPSSFVSKIMKRQRVAQWVYKYLVCKLERVEGNGNAFLVIYKKK